MDHSKLTKAQLIQRVLELENENLSLRGGEPARVNTSGQARRILDSLEFGRLSKDWRQVYRTGGHYRSLVENLGIGVYRITFEDGRFLQANTAMARIFGLGSAEELMRYRADDLYLDPRDRQQVLESVRHKSGINNFKLLMKRMDGSPFWCQISVRLVTGAKGEPLWLDGAMEDIHEKEEAARALEISRQRYQILVENSFDGIMVHRTGPIVLANSRLHQILGYEPGELLGLPCTIIFPPELRDRVIDKAKRRLAGEKLGNRYEIIMQRKDGSTINVELSAGVVTVDGERAIQVWIRDISRRKKAALALASSEERFRTLSESAPDIIYTTDPQGRLTYVNPAWTRILGFEAAEVLGRRFIDFVAKQDHKKLLALYVDIRRTKKTHQLTSHLMSKNGGGRVFIMSGAPHLDDSGQLVGIAGMLKDITERTLAEQALKISEERHRSALEASPDPVVIYDSEGRTEYVNPAFCQFFGWSREELLGKNIDFVPQDQKNTISDLVAKVLEHGDMVRNFDTQRLTKSGELKDVSVSSARYGGGGELAPGIITTLRDITKRKAAQRALVRSEANLARAQAMARLGHWELDLDSGRFFFSEQAREIYGIKKNPKGLGIKDFLKVVHREDRDKVERSFSDAAIQGEMVNQEHRIVLPDGEKRVVNQLAEVVYDAANHPVKLMGAVQDITDRRQSEDQMRLLARVFENTIEGIMVTNAQARIVMINRAFSSISGYSPKEVLGNTPSILASGRQDPKFYSELWRELKATGNWQGEIWNRRKNGETYPEWLTITAITGRRGKVTHYVGVFHDITEVKANEEKITYQAYHDSLTGLPNRFLFNDRLSMALAHAQRKGQSLAVLFLDLDNFKNINDSLGHAVGDMLLQSVSGRLVRWLRDEDTVARIGGDEFIMLLHGAEDENYPTTVAQRILDQLTEPFMANGHELFITASIGITLFPHDGKDLDALVSNADLAMYRAKESGRNNYKMFTPSMNVKVTQRLSLESALRKALDLDQFLVFYQPKVDLADNRMVGVEALVRWQRPKMGIMNPDEFIPLAEETGLIVPIGQWVLRTACENAKNWHAQGFGHLQVSVNISPRQFLQKNLVEMVSDTLGQTGLEPEFLELEVTEGVVMQSVDEAIKTLRKLRDLGVRLTMDDFGRGYSSLYYLKRFPMNALKIDRSFVADMLSGEQGASIVNTIISMSRNLDLQVVAEGVETGEQMQALCDNDCHLMQGFFFSHPVPPGRITEMLRRGTFTPEDAGP